jgi:hypothetical protein
MQSSKTEFKIKGGNTCISITIVRLKNQDPLAFGAVRHKKQD